MGGRRLSNVSYTPIGLNVGQLEKSAMAQEAAKHGLSVITAAIFLAGEMAGSGVLALPNAMIGTGWGGTFLVLLFTVNACFSGTRLGYCWVILEERYDEFKKEIRDPYPSIGEKAVGTFGRIMSTICICFTLYGAGCVFIVLISQLSASLLSAAGCDLSICLMMVFVTAMLIPLTWLGSPKDFWPMALGALVTTSVACLLIVIQAILDHRNSALDIEYPTPTAEGTFKAFAAVMFAFAGASTFPTIQTDMKEREKFHYSVIIACCILILIYMPMAVAGYYSYGSLALPNVVLSLSGGPIKIVVEVMLLLHLVAAFPIILNPPSQYFEHIIKIPSDFNWKRCSFRALSVLFLLFIAETIPSFGSILDLVGASTVTLLTFVFPPFFYMRLCDKSKENMEWKQWSLPLWERIYCWVLILLGLAGGISATYTSFKNIVSTEMQIPCYMQSGNVTVAADH